MSHDITLPAEEISAPKAAARLPVIAGGMGLVGLVATYFLSGGHADRALAAYLVAFLFFLSLALGGLFFVLVQFASRAGWSVVVRRLAEQVAGTLPVFAVLFLPIAFGVHDLYHWSHAEAVAHDELLQHKEAFLNSPFFLGRSAFYVLSWAALAWWFRKRSLTQDESGDPEITRKLQSQSAPALIVFAVTVTFASIDWVMSLDPHWYSTIFGVYFFSGCFLGLIAFLILMVLRLQRGGQLQHVVTYEHFHDLGKLLFAFVVFWAYIAFSQFMLIWYGNIPEETVWYAHRWQHGWKEVSIALAVGHFVVPFFFLLPRDVKRSKATLTLGALWLLAVHYLDLYWLVMPTFQHEAFAPAWVDLTSLIGVSGIFLATLGWLMRDRLLIPKRDPRLAESLSFENV